MDDKRFTWKPVTHSLTTFRQTTQNVEPVLRSVGGKKVLDRVRSPARTTKKVHRPLGDTLFFDVAILTRLRLVDIFVLSNKRKRFLRALCALGESCRLVVCCKGVVIVVAILV